MAKFSEEQMQELWLLNKCLTEKKTPITEENKKRIVDFVRFCINNKKINKAAYHLIKAKTTTEYPEAATNFILILSFRTRRWPEVSTSFEDTGNLNIESLRHYAIFRDISRVKLLLNELEESMLEHNPRLRDFKIKVLRTHDKISEIESQIKQGLQSNKIDSFSGEKKMIKLEEKWVHNLKQEFSYLVKFFKAKNFPHP